MAIHWHLTTSLRMAILQTRLTRQTLKKAPHSYGLQRLAISSPPNSSSIIPTRTQNPINIWRYLRARRIGRPIIRMERHLSCPQGLQLLVITSVRRCMWGWSHQWNFTCPRRSRKDWALQRWKEETLKLKEAVTGSNPDCEWNVYFNIAWELITGRRSQAHTMVRGTTWIRPRFCPFIR